MKLVSEVSDPELSERFTAALAAHGIEHRVQLRDEGGIELRQIEVADQDFEATCALIEAAERDWQSEHSRIRCGHCGTGMIVLKPGEVVTDEGDMVADYVCPKCAAVRPVLPG